ncbi:uncharacterized protein CEXT_575841 [Caerostris extrusa]|uniref:RNI-like protein n=1 Tax=Caerostris extrusa TaxID=172846 RepID=A0AAV4XDU3_CAEEX|nr:uncharacterized protein CEXT_575841 [Caerostris extrusa]
MSIEKPTPLELLLKSGQLQNLFLDGCDFTKKQWRSLMTILLEEGDSCRNITYIILPESFQNDENSSLERLIEKCPLLQILDVSTYFNLSALKNCVRLKYVKNYFTGKKEYRYFRNESADTLANLQNLETFAIFHSRMSLSYYLHTAKMLQNHPKLVSLGYTDSSWAAHYIYTTRKMYTVPRFGLKECFWGFNSYVNKFNRREQIAYTQQYSKFVKSSVALFPLFVPWIAHTYRIYFLVKRNWPTTQVLCDWESQSHASRRCHEILFKCGTFAFMLQRNRSGGIEIDSKNFRQLEKLIVREVDEESLEYLLRNALNMRELLLFDAFCLDDTLLHKIFEKNSLTQLNTIAVHECSLSREGLKELIQRCVNLESVAFENLDADLRTVAEELKRDIRATYSNVARSLLVI